MNIQTIVNRTNQIIQTATEQNKLTKQVLAIGIEINQRYLEYLEELETMPLHIQNGVTIEIDGQRVHFDNQADFETWLAEKIS